MQEEGLSNWYGGWLWVSLFTSARSVPSHILLNPRRAIVHLHLNVDCFYSEQKEL